MKKILFIIIFLPLFANAQINVVKNFATANTFMQFDNNLFFYANDGVNIGLWKTDGTTAGTVFVKALNGIEISVGREHIVSGGLLYFNDTGGVLWRTDGTTSGTFMLNSGYAQAFHRVDLNGVLIFAALDSDGIELWRSDGTLTGTYKITDFYSGSNSGFGSRNMAKQGNYIYFVGRPNSSLINPLCRTDGTASGTQVVPNSGTVQSDLNEINGKIIFSSVFEYNSICVGQTNSINQVQKIMKAEDGVCTPISSHSTYILGNYPTNYCTYLNSNFGNTQFFRKSGNKLFFRGQIYPNPGISNFSTDQLWATDGTNLNLLKMFPAKNIGSFSEGPGALEPFYFAMENSIDNSFFGDIFYFPAGDDNSGHEVWRSDGTVAGTFLLKEIRDGNTSSDPTDFRTANGITYFTAHDGTKRKLFKTDGSTAGTIEVPDPNSVLNLPSSTNQLNTPANQKNLWSNAIGSKFLFVGTPITGSGITLFSVCTPPPTPTIVSSIGSPICEGSTTTLSSTCIGTSTWNTGATSSTITVSPTVTTTYSIVCSNSCGTSNSASFYLNVFPLPTIPTFVTRSVTICPGNSVTLLASGCNGTMQWSNGTTGTPFIVSEPGVYTATCSNSCGTSLPSHTFTVQHIPLNVNLSGIAPGGLARGIQTISSTQTYISGNYGIYNASKSITLNPNFTANSGSVFTAEIKNPCPITNGLVFHLPFNGNANNVAGGYSDGIVANATLTTDRNGNLNSAYYFNGTNAYIHVPNNASFGGTAELTLLAWIRPEDLNGTYRGIITKWFQNTSNDTYSMLLANTNQILAAVKGNPEIFSGMISANNWIQVVYTHSSTLDKIYINGVLVSTINVSVGVASTTIPIIIGADNNNGTIWRFFKGKIDEVKIYNRALTVQEIEYQYASESIPFDINTGLIASYNLDNNFTDQSGNGHNATFASAILTTGRKGIASTAYSFNGINHRINLGTWFNLQTFTISMWLNTGSTQANAYAMIIDNNHGGNLMWNMQQRNTTLNLYDFGLSGSPGTGQAFNLTPNQWTHIVITCTGSTLSLYKNGILSGSSTYTGPIIYNGTQSLCLGAWVNSGAYGRFWNGKMDDIKIYNRAISAVEVSYLFSE